jgi:hypothetical protein
VPRSEPELRTRFVLWVALQELAAALDLALAGARGGEASVTDVVDQPTSALRDFPVSTRGQPLAWWKRTLTAAQRMAEAMRTGQRWNPRTPDREHEWRSSGLDAA